MHDELSPDVYVQVIDRVTDERLGKIIVTFAVEMFAPSPSAVMVMVTLLPVVTEEGLTDEEFTVGEVISDVNATDTTPLVRLL